MVISLNKRNVARGIGSRCGTCPVRFEMTLMLAVVLGYVATQPATAQTGTFVVTPVLPRHPHKAS